MRLLAVGLALIGATGAGMAIAPAASADGWTEPVTLSGAEPDARTGFPMVAVAPNGWAVAAWVEDIGEAPRLVARAISPAGATTETRAISAPGISTGMFERLSDIAMGPDGVATIVWVQQGSRRVMARRMRSDGTLASGRITVSEPTSALGLRPAVAVGPDGTAAIAWHQSGIDESSMQFRRLSPEGDTGPQRELVASGATVAPRVDVLPDGTANVVAVVDQNPGVELQSIRVPEDGAHTLRVVATDNSMDQPDTASDAAGNVHVVWRNGASDPFASRIPPAGAPSAPVVIGGKAADPLVVSAAPDGTATAILRTTTDPSRALARRIGPDGTLGSLLELAPGPAFMSRPAVATETDGTTTAIWTQEISAGTFQSTANVRRISPAGTFVDGPHVLSPPGLITLFGLDVAAGPPGSTIAVWQEDPAFGPDTVRASRYLVTPPVPPVPPTPPAPAPPAPAPAPAPAPPAPPASTPAQTIQPPPATIARAHILSRTALVRAGWASLAVRCRVQGATRCQGTLAITAASGRGARAAGASSARFSIRAGRAATVRVRLSRRMLAAVRRNRRLTVRAVVRTRQANGRLTITGTRRVVLRAPRASGQRTRPFAG